MARYDDILQGDVDEFMHHLDDAIMSGSVSATCEDRVSCQVGDIKMRMWVYERYSAWSSNRVSLSIGVLAADREILVSAVTSGGSEAIVWKLDTIGEKTFLDRAIDAIRSFADHEPSSQG